MLRATLILVAALLATGTAWAGETTVVVGHNRIEPAEIRIAVGDTVVFHNVDAMPGGHTVKADDGSFESPPLEKDQKWSHTFGEAGSYPIGIAQHPEARATVIVE